MDAAQNSPAYRRVIVKVSGEALSGPEGFGVHQPTVDRIAEDLIAARKAGFALGVVVGGGNILRGVKMSGKSLSRPTADSMGMLATVMNGLVLEAAIERLGAPARTMSALSMPQVCETYERQRALRHFEENRIVVRAAEMECDAVLKATDVDGVYSADPKKDPKAERYDQISLKEAFDRDLKVLDATAFALARENSMPIIVFSIRVPGAIEAVLRGTGRATVVSG
jgi:uridylate kinase